MSQRFPLEAIVLGVLHILGDTKRSWGGKFNNEIMPESSRQPYVLAYVNLRRLINNGMTSVLDQHLHLPLTKHRKSMLDRPPTIGPPGPQDDLRSSYKQWEEKHSRIMQEPPKEGREYINHAIKVLPFIEAPAEANPIAKG